MQTYVLTCLIVFLAGFTQGLSGFGSILLSLPLLAIFLDIKIVIPLVALIALCITIILFIQLWEHLDWKKFYPLFLGALPGIPLGVFFLKKLDKDLIQWILGVILISFGRKRRLDCRKPKAPLRQGLQPNCDQVCVLLKIISILPILSDIT